MQTLDVSSFTSIIYISSVILKNENDSDVDIVFIVVVVIVNQTLHW